MKKIFILFLFLVGFVGWVSCGSENPSINTNVTAPTPEKKPKIMKYGYDLEDHEIVNKKIKGEILSDPFLRPMESTIQKYTIFFRPLRTK